MTRMLPDPSRPRKFPKITIEQEKCPVPFVCKKCLQACPEVVLQVGLAGPQERLKETDPRIPGTWRIGVLRRDFCTACMQCVEVCPVGAIKVEVPEATATKA
jgi:NAD-dependent dihydropyrimidine dehydrogenase PreA subunit